MDTQPRNRTGAKTTTGKKSEKNVGRETITSRPTMPN